MGKNKIILTGLVLLLFAIDTMGEVNRYVVYFKDKIGNSYSIESPETFLSTRSIRRRAHQNIPVTESDLPVSGYYLDQIKNIADINLYFTSKWLNCVLIETDEIYIDVILAFSFVKKVEYVAPGSQMSDSRTSKRRRKGTNEVPAYDISSYVTQEQNMLIRADIMHEKGYLGEGMLIGVFDSGFKNVDTSPYFSHLFDNDRIQGKRVFINGSNDVFGFDIHGTKVLSCIGGFMEDEYSGTAPNADFVLCVTEDISSEYRIEEYNWLFAAEYADSLGVDIINSSVGYSYFDDESMDYTYEDLNGKVTIITRAATIAASKGIVVVSSVGNEGDNSWRYLNAPADADSILSIGAVTMDEERSGFSSFGPTSDGRIKPDISALGSYTKVVVDNEVTISNGTSFSTPLVTGLVAGFWQAFPDLNNMEVIEYLKMSASQAEMPDTLIGYGIPNFIDAYRNANESEKNIINTFVVYPNPVTNERIVYILSDSLFNEQQEAKIDFYDLRGGHVKSGNYIIKNSKSSLEINVSFLRPGSYILMCSVGDKTQKSKLIVP